MNVSELVNSKNPEDVFLGLKNISSDCKFFRYARQFIGSQDFQDLKVILRYLQPEYINEYYITDPISHRSFPISLLKTLIVNYETFEFKRS